VNNERGLWYSYLIISSLNVVDCRMGLSQGLCRSENTVYPALLGNFHEGVAGGVIWMCTLPGSGINSPDSDLWDVRV
jgi:hypothetical protein